MSSRPVVVGVDGSPPSLAAAAQAAAIADARGVTLELVHGYLHPFGYGTAPLEPYAVLPPPEPEGGEEMLTELSRSLRESHPDLTVSHRQVLGGGAPTLLAASEEAQLLVVGCRGHGGFAGLLLGSVSTQVVAHARCPVLVVRPAEPAADSPDAPVVVGVDGSTTSALALELAGAEAAHRHRPLVVLHAEVPPGNAAREAADTLLTDAAETIRTAHPGLRVQGRPHHGTDAAAALIAASDGAALVVVGSRGRGGFTGLLLGSVSQALVHHAYCPVLVVPPAIAPASGEDEPT